MVRRVIVAFMVFMVLMAMVHGTGDVSASPPGDFNPFSVPQIRLAVQYLVNRSYMAFNVTDNSSYPVLGPPSGIYSVLNITEGGNFRKALEMINGAMEKLKARGYPLEKVNGVWYYAGRPVVVRLFMPAVEPYRRVGFYVADLLQKAGFVVNKFVVDYGTIYTRILPSGSVSDSGSGSGTGSSWDVYVGGVTVRNLTYPAAYFSLRPLEFSNVTVGDMISALGLNLSGFIKALNLSYTPEELAAKTGMNEKDLLLSLLSGRYGSSSDMRKLLTALSVFSSERIPLVRMREYYAYNSTVAFHSRLGMYAQDGSLLWGPFDPLTGSLDPNSAYVWGMISRHRCRAEVSLGSFRVPKSAVPFAGFNGSSEERISYVCEAANWTNGQPLTANDFRYYMEFLREYGGSLYSALFSNVMAFQPVQGNGTVGYVLYLRKPAPSSLYEFYPPLPWDVSFAVAQLISNASSYGINERFSLYGGSGTVPVNLAGDKTVKALEKVLSVLHLSGRSPDFISSRTAVERYSSDLRFVSKYGNLLIGTGPYVISGLSRDVLTLKSTKNGSEVVFTGFSSVNDLVKALEAGKIDGVATPLPRYAYSGMPVEDLLKTEFLSVNDTYVYLFFRAPRAIGGSTTSSSSSSSSTATSSQSSSTHTTSSSATHSTSTSTTHSTSSTTSSTHSTSSSSMTTSSSTSSSTTSSQSSSTSTTSSKKKS
ncbi:MAG: hypothetical protein GXO14_00790, partial [Thermococci archaeon]|nr:hypothetical protein [Thermococci archaeon]